MIARLLFALIGLATLLGMGWLVSFAAPYLLWHALPFGKAWAWLNLPAIIAGTRPTQFQVLLDEVIDISQAGASKEMTFSNRYSGFHEVCLIPAPRFAAKTTIYWREAPITVDISMEAGSKTRKISIRSETPGCTEYLAPEDLPVASPVLVTATVTETVAIVAEEYAPVRLRIVEEPWR